MKEQKNKRRVINKARNYFNRVRNLNLEIRVRVRPRSPRRFAQFRDQGTQPILKRRADGSDSRAMNVVEDMAG